jgi:hypothetical protein
MALTPHLKRPLESPSLGLDQSFPLRVSRQGLEGPEPGRAMEGDQGGDHGPKRSHSIPEFPAGHRQVKS